MKIGMLLDRIFPPDIRVEKEARALLKAGHEVHLLCVKTSDLPDEDVYEEIKLHRREFYHKSSLIRKLGVLANRVTFKNYKLIPRIEELVDEN